jgi:hypothetical protein
MIGGLTAVWSLVVAGMERPPMKNKDSTEYSYGERETQARMLAALCGARLAGLKPMASMTPKRSKAQRKLAS